MSNKPLNLQCPIKKYVRKNKTNKPLVDTDKSRNAKGGSDPLHEVKESVISGH